MTFKDYLKTIRSIAFLSIFTSVIVAIFIDSIVLWIIICVAAIVSLILFLALLEWKKERGVLYNISMPIFLAVLVVVTILRIIDSPLSMAISNIITRSAVGFLFIYLFLDWKKRIKEGA